MAKHQGEHHLSHNIGGKGGIEHSIESSGPIPQHSRDALGEPIDGMTNPNGMEKPAGKSTIAGQRCNY